MFNNELTPAERVTKSRIRLMNSNPFYGYILLEFDVKQTHKETLVDTFAVNKYGHLYYNPEFVTKQSDSQIDYILCHEVLHIAKGDFFRVGNRHPMIWNIASDCVINDYCNMEGGMTPPDNGYVPDDSGSLDVFGKTINVRGKITEEVYDEIIDHVKKEIEKLKKEGKLGELGEGGHGGFDVHLDMDDNDQGESEGNAEKDGEGNESGTSKRYTEEKWKRVATQSAERVLRDRGTLPGHLSDLIDSLHQCKIDWKTKLKSLITNEIPIDYHNRRPGRSFYATGVWAPTVLKENMNIFLSVDCSGSTMGDREDFLSECLGVMTAHPQIKGRLICWDMDVQDENDIEVSSNSLEVFKKLNLKDINGGTDLSAYTRHLDKKGYNSSIHIILTDGYIEQNPQIPSGRCIFVLSKGGDDSIIRNYGDVIFIDKKR